MFDFLTFLNLLVVIEQRIFLEFFTSLFFFVIFFPTALIFPFPFTTGYSSPTDLINRGGGGDKELSTPLLCRHETKTINRPPGEGGEAKPGRIVRVCIIA